MEAMSTHDYPWDDMHHHAYFLPQQSHDQYVVEYKDFTHGEGDWFRHPIRAPDAFIEGNMANISPTIKINISDKLWIKENIILGHNAPWKKLKLAPSYSNNSMMFSPGLTPRCLNLIPPLFNIISTHGLMPLSSIRS